MVVPAAQVCSELLQKTGLTTGDTTQMPIIRMTEHFLCITKILGTIMLMWCLLINLLVLDSALILQIWVLRISDGKNPWLLRTSIISYQISISSTLNIKTGNFILLVSLLLGITFQVGPLSLPGHSVRKGSQVQDSAGALSLGIPCTGSYYGNL